MSSPRNSKLLVRRLRLAAGLLLGTALVLLIITPIIIRAVTESVGASFTFGPELVIPALALVVLGMAASFAAAIAQYRVTAEQAYAVAAERRALEEAGQPMPESYPQDTRPETLRYELVSAVSDQIRAITLPLATIAAAFFFPADQHDTVKITVLTAVAIIAVVVTAGGIVVSAVARQSKSNANARWEIAQREAREAAATTADPS